ncbi:MAG TPA: hypothetical protein VGN90_09865 [Pyrinomonadaceae bacterium]|nr:hypothetical protein [Pyrinomonadaceae bacterium]
MSSQTKLISDAYRQLSSLYKNPTRNTNSGCVDGLAADNVNERLMQEHRALLNLFNRERQEIARKDPALYYKILALLYEVDDYCGVRSSVREFIVAEYRNLIEKFAQNPDDEGNRPLERINFTNAKIRSRLKAMIRCCVAAIESRRREDDLDDLSGKLNILEDFLNRNLHRPGDLPAWTTLAFVQSAQARLARQAQDYEQAHRKLLREVDSLNQRAAEIVDCLFVLNKVSNPSDEQRNEIEGLKDDLVFIRRKQTLSSFFNAGLAAFQRGFLRSARQACEAASLQFRLHGQFFHQVFNDLVILSIKRARTSKEQQDSFRALKDDLEQAILPRLNPVTGVGNPKLYLYAMRELAVLQYYCKETDKMAGTLDQMDDLMDKYGLVSEQWKSRISIQRSRAFWRDWVHQKERHKLKAALKHAQDAFSFGCGVYEKISTYRNARALRAAIERSKKISLIDTIESLINYGSIQASAKQFAEAIKSADAVIQLAGDDNPRLCAMGHLVRAEAHTANAQVAEAQQDLAHARVLEKRVDHRYVGDRRRLVERAIEERLPQTLFLGDLNKEDFRKATNRLLGWFIETHSKKGTKNDVARTLDVSRTRIDSYLEYLKKPENESEPYHHLIAILDSHGEKQKAKTRKKPKKT